MGNKIIKNLVPEASCGASNKIPQGRLDGMNGLSTGDSASKGAYFENAEHLPS